MTRGGSMSRKKGVSEAKVTLPWFFDNRANTSWKVRAQNRLVSIWHPPECQFCKTESCCKAAEDKCLFPHHKVDGATKKKKQKSHHSHKRIQCWIAPIYSLSLFVMTNFRDSIQDGTKLYCRWARSHPMISWKVCTNWEYESLFNSKPCWNCIAWKFIRRYRNRTIRGWKPWWREAQIRNSEYETLTPEMRESKQEQWFRIAGINVVLKEDKEFAVNGKQKASVREETRVVSSTTEMSVQNRHQKPLHPPSHHHKEVEVRPREGSSEVGVHLGSSLDSRAKITWKGICTKSLCIGMQIRW